MPARKPIAETLNDGLVHSITNADLDSKIGDCSVCGVGVRLSVANEPQPGKTTRMRWCAKKRAMSTVARNRFIRLGITDSQLRDLLAEQGSKCLICQENEATDIDHCHNTGRIRGLLCNGCNSGIGLLADPPERLRAAADYLESYA